MKKNTKLSVAFLALLALAALFTGLYLSSRPAPTAAVKSVTVEVLHSDQTQKIFRFQTDKEYLGELLLAEGLVKGEQGPYGLYITEVDGEVADYAANKAYWALFVGEEYATQGADTTPLTDGGSFTLVYSVG